MKNIDKSPEEPVELREFRACRPSASWDEFKAKSDSVNGKDGVERYKAVKKLLRSDQGGLCAYCEIDLKKAEKPAIDDFRVEHFHPKSDRLGEKNWGLEWMNLLACCHGGSNEKVIDKSERYTPGDYSCDIPKKNDNLDLVILNPLDIPASPCLFKFIRSNGNIEVNKAHCATAGIDPEVAQATIDKLNLNATRLKRMRVKVLDKLNLIMAKEIDEISLRKKRKELAKAYLSKRDGDWFPFFSAIRDYLGQAAEEYLNRSDRDDIESPRSSLL